jgi:hypothetical protein
MATYKGEPSRRKLRARRAERRLRRASGCRVICHGWRWSLVKGVRRPVVALQTQ